MRFFPSDAVVMASAKQRALLVNLTRTQAFSGPEADRTIAWLASPKATKKAASSLIRRAKERIRKNTIQMRIENLKPMSDSEYQKVNDALFG